MVIKVASRTTTRTINSFGFGSNITVDYTALSQFKNKEYGGGP